MTDLDKYLKMLKSPKASVRYDACEELRVVTESSPEIILALIEATQDENKDVAERARQAFSLEVHQQMAFQVGIDLPIVEVKSEPDIAPEPEQPARETNRLAIASLFVGVLGIFASAIGQLWLICLILAQECVITFPFTEELKFSFVAGTLLGLIGLTAGIFALLEIKKNGEYQKGRGIAITGILLGILACLPGLIFLVWRYLIYSRVSL